MTEPIRPTATLSRVVVVTGLGGSGKSTALRALEDLGFYCIDNLPIVLLDRFMDLVHSKPDITKVALVVDVRDVHFLDSAPDELRDAMDAGVPIELIFLDAQDDVLVRRYSETRRVHPLSGAGSIRDGIAEERRRLTGLRALAHTTVDTNELSGHELKRLIVDRYGTSETTGSVLTVMSFGYKHGVPVEADLVFDVRFLPNPYYNLELRELRGTDPPVRNHVMSFVEADVFLERVDELLAFLIPLYAREGRHYLTIAIGCTGGHHRSVALAEELATRLEQRGERPRIMHRDRER